MNMMKKNWLIEKPKFIIFEIIISDESHYVGVFPQKFYSVVRD
jgi:hypothetical protein